jgi:hypothetical protein
MGAISISDRHKKMVVLRGLQVGHAGRCRLVADPNCLFQLEACGSLFSTSMEKYLDALDVSRLVLLRNLVSVSASLVAAVISSSGIIAHFFRP